jgi:cell volume regulation protein A
VIVAVLLLLGLLASKVSGRLGVPALLLFMAIGMLAGSEGIGGIDFDDYEVAQGVGVVALAFTLYTGGLDTEWGRVRGLLGPGIALATAGTLVTAVVVGLAAAWILGLSPTAGLLLGSVVSSTDAAAVFSVLRSGEVSLKGDLRPLLELESGSNDPMAVFLTLGCLELLTEPATGAAGILLLFVAQMGVGLAVGLAVGFGSVWAINRIRLGFEGLYPVGLIATVLLAYGAADLLHGSGFLAVYTTGLVMSRSHFLHKKSLMRFADGLAWLMQIAMFLVLGLLVFPSQLGAVAGRALAVAAVLILVARPLAAGLLLAPTRFNLRETVLVSWVGLRGAVPIILATFPLVEGILQAALVFNVVFFVVLASVLVQGTTIPWVARLLRVDAPVPRRDPYPMLLVESKDG